MKKLNNTPNENKKPEDEAQPTVIKTAETEAAPVKKEAPKKAAPASDEFNLDDFFGDGMIK